MAEDGCIKSQFETQTSNGSLSAHLGGDRWHWEHEAFGGAYDNAKPQDRPKYGALNFRGHLSGGSPRFGSAFFRLKSHVHQRATFCFPESYFSPNHFSTTEGIAQLIKLFAQSRLDQLDHYIEAHIHGTLSLEQDIETLVLDPCYVGTTIEQLAKELPCKLEWHQGFSITAQCLEPYSAYRGKSIIELAHKLAVQNPITPLLLGQALQQQLASSEAIRKLWHYLARYGDQNLGDQNLSKA